MYSKRLKRKKIFVKISYEHVFVHCINNLKNQTISYAPRIYLCHQSKCREENLMGMRFFVELINLNEVRLFQEKIRSRVANSTKNTQRVINHCFNDAFNQMVARLPNFEHISRNTQRQRQKNDLSPMPHDRNFIIILPHVLQLPLEMINFCSSTLD